MAALKNKGDLLVLALVTGFFLLVYTYVQSGRWSDSLYGLVLYGLLWIVYFVQSSYREKKAVEKVQRGDLEDLQAKSPVEEALLEKIEKMKEEARAGDMEDLKDRKALTDYLVRWSHQIKIPLAALSAWMDAEKIEDPGARLQLFKIEEYLDHILTYERLRGKDTDYVFQWISLRGVIQRAIRAYAPLFIDKGLSVDLAPGDVEILTDQKWLLFFIKQWLSNVVKYTERGGLKINFQEGVLTFQDSGIGIAKEDLPRVMDMGYTGYMGREYEKSTGLGLYLMKEVAQNLNLGLKLESAPGEGTCLSVLFPKETYRMSH